MKILHISDDPLPDWRVEKSALSLKNKDNQVYFAGVTPLSMYNRKILTKYFKLVGTPKLDIKFLMSGLKLRIN